MTKQDPCPCGSQSVEVCTYINTMRICHGRPELIIRDPEKMAELVAYFKERKKR